MDSFSYKLPFLGVSKQASKEGEEPKLHIGRQWHTISRKGKNFTFVMSINLLPRS